MARRRNAGEGRYFSEWMAAGARNSTLAGRIASAAQSTCTAQRLPKCRMRCSRRAQIGGRLPIAVERQTLAQYLADWLENSVRPSVRPLTFEQYRQHVDTSRRCSATTA